MFMRAGQMDRINCTENEKEEEGLRTHQKADMAQRLRAYFRVAFFTRGSGGYPNQWPGSCWLLLSRFKPWITGCQ